MIAAAMSMRRRFPRTLPLGLSSGLLRSSLLGRSAAVAPREAPETQRAPAESEGVAARKSRAGDRISASHPIKQSR